MELRSGKKCRPIKRRRDALVEEDGRDRISALDDDVLLHILSLMPTIYAVRTGVLSKRWLYLWTSLPCLTFHDTDGDDSDIEIDNFSPFVDRTLFFHKSPKITKFDLVTTRWYLPLLNTWIRFAILRNVEELSLNCYNEFGAGTVPRHLFECSSLTKMTLINWYVKLKGLVKWKGQVKWTSLKELKLDKCWVDQGLADSMLRGTPILERLELCDCEGIEKLHITSPALKELVLKIVDIVVEDPLEYPLEIDAPYLHSLSITGGFLVESIQLLRFPSLATAKINIDYGDIGNHEIGNMFIKMLERFCHVTKLTLGDAHIQFLPDLDAKSFNLPTLKCKSLTLIIEVIYRDIPKIAALLYSSCELEELIIDMVTTHYYIERGDSNSSWTSYKRKFTCLTSCLKTIKIMHRGYQFQKEKPVLAFMQFLLKEAYVLEKMVFLDCNQVKKKEPSVQVTRKLLSFPRSSPHAMILFA